MVSASKPADQATPVPAAAIRPVAKLNARISGYIVDSVILLAFVLVFFVIGGSILLFTSDLGSGEAPDWAYYAFLAVFLGGTLIVWSVFNVALLAWRAQTAGMYVVGVRTVLDDGSSLTSGRALLRWFGLHPLFFHPLLLPVWAMLSLLLVSLIVNQVAVIITVTLVLLCAVSPVAGLLAMIFDPERRGLHDRLSRTIVVHIDSP
jgi:uncharacterized RDD family membrane protein YckC